MRTQKNLLKTTNPGQQSLNIRISVEYFVDKEREKMSLMTTLNCVGTGADVGN